MNLYDRLMELKDIKDGYKKWKDYREELTEYIISHSEKGYRIAIYGAGRCNDIDIGMLQKRNKEITLIDNDIASMHQAIYFYHLKQTELIEKDFLGIEAEEYRQYASVLESIVREEGLDTDVNEMADIAAFMLTNMYERAFKKELDFGIEVYDIAVCAGVCSQINNMSAWIWEILLQSINATEQSVYQMISNYNKKAVTRFHDAVIRSAKNSVIFVNEWLRYGTEGYVEGAYQAIMDLNSRKETHNCKEEILYWPFNKDSNVEYKMLLQHLEKR